MSLQGDFAEQFAEAFKAIGRVNLAVFGKTGVGKSTLVNSFFGVDVARTGIGSPVTSGLDYYKVPGRPFGLYDSQGFEVGESADLILSKMRSIVNDSRGLPIGEQVHAIWYCVRSADKRFEDSQVKFVNELLTLKLPVLLVLTQVPKKGDEFDPEALELADKIRAMFLHADKPAGLVMTNAKANDFIGVPQHGLDTLLDKTADIVPEAVRQALIAAQHFDMKRKRTEAGKIVTFSAAAAAGAAAIPIPFASLAGLLPVEAAMFGRIAAIYGLPMTSQVAAQLALTALVGQGARAGAVMVGENLLKFVPGVNVAAGVIQAGAASAMTVAAGGAWIVVCEQLAKREPSALKAMMNSSEVSDMFREAFKRQARGKS